jgi:hypothetical protein
MGQQQLLLIVLGVIVVGIAVVVGFNMFNSNAISSNRDSIVSDLNNLGTIAQQYWRRPSAMGGGDRSFTGWTIPTHTDTTPNGVYVATVAAQTITIVGTGTENFDGSPVVHTAAITPFSIAITQTH